MVYYLIIKNLQLWHYLLLNFSRTQISCIWNLAMEWFMILIRTKGRKY